MVGRGNGMIGTPGGSGGWGGAGWAAAGWGATLTSAGLDAGAASGGDGLRWLAGREAGLAGAALRATEDDFEAVEAVLGRANLALGLAFAFEVVTRPFALERRSELRSAPLPIRRCRSTLWIQV
jgi:hypothetical protein